MQTLYLHIVHCAVRLNVRRAEAYYPPGSATPQTGALTGELLNFGAWPGGLPSRSLRPRPKTPGGIPVAYPLCYKNNYRPAVADKE